MHLGKKNKKTFEKFRSDPNPESINFSKRVSTQKEASSVMATIDHGRNELQLVVVDKKTWQSGKAVEQLPIFFPNRELAVSIF